MQFMLNIDYIIHFTLQRVHYEQNIFLILNNSLYIQKGYTKCVALLNACWHLVLKLSYHNIYDSEFKRKMY
jgi:hypothetical protein